MKPISKARHSVSTRQSRFAAIFLPRCLLLCLPAILAPGLGAQSPNADPAGTWKGELGEGAAKLHLVITITKSANGEFSGELESVDQGATLPMDNITLKADLLRFEVKAVGGIYEGTLNPAKTGIAGTWTQS